MGEAVGHYRILERLGTDRLGESFRARDTRAGRTVVVTVLPDASDPADRERLLAAARSATELSHLGLATLFEVGRDEDSDYLVFEHVTGDTLRTMVGGQPLNARRAVDIAAQMADALAVAHAHGMTHGQLTSDNVIVTPRGTVKILRCGVSQPADRQVSEADDVRSLAACLGEMLPPNVGTALAALARQPPESAASMAARLRALAAELEERAAPAARPVVTRHREERSKSWIWIALVVVAIAAVLVWFALRAS